MAGLFLCRKAFLPLSFPKTGCYTLLSLEIADVAELVDAQR